MLFQLAEPGVTHSIHSSCLKSIEGDPDAEGGSRWVHFRSLDLQSSQGWKRKIATRF
jgi:hypothetical protein